MAEKNSEELISLLVIDDDIILTEMIAVTYPSDGFEVTIANSGSEGVEAARRIEPDVILLDLMMPGMNGWQVCEEIRQFSRVPILIMSAIVDSPKVMQALDAGANDYLVKPPPQAVLVARLKRLVQQSRAK